MKLYSKILISTIILTNVLIFALVPEINNDEVITKIDSIKQNLMIVKKRLNIEGMTSGKTLSLSGTMKVAYLTGYDLALSGCGLLDNCTIDHNSELEGEYIITNSSLGALILVGDFVSLSKCTLDSITVKETKSESIPCVELINTQIKGRIIFEGKHGIVIMDKYSKALVMNGDIIKK